MRYSGPPSAEIAEVRGIEGDYVVNKWFAKKRRLVIIALVAGAIGALTATAVAQTQRFPDVPVDHYAYEAVEWAAEVGVTTGHTDGTFKPEQPLIKRHAVVFMERYYDEILQAEESEDFTRGDMMVLLKAINDGTIDDTAAESDTAAGSRPAEEAGQRFPDVPVDHYAYEAVEWAAEVGVTTGHTDGTFKPEQPLIKRHAVVFMERYYDEILQAEESEDFTRGDMMVLLKAINDGTIDDTAAESDTAAGSRPAEEALTPSAGEVVSASWWHSCGVRVDGTVTCWGSNEHLVYHDSQPRWIADGKLDAPSGRFLSVAVSSSHSCGVRVDQSAVCWGRNEQGQANAPSGQFLSVTVSSSRSCGVRVDQSVVCWGFNISGELNAPSGQFLSVTSSSSHLCALRADQTVVCWGDDTYGQLNAPSGQFSHLAAGSIHTCGVRVDQSLTCWGGFNQGGESNVPAEAFLSVSVASGNSYKCGVRLDRALVCWEGDLHYYADTAELVHPSLVRDPNLRYFEDAETAERRLLDFARLHRSYLLAPAGEFLSVAAGQHHACAVRVDRTVVCWGMNDQGQANAPTGQFGP